MGRALSLYAPAMAFTRAITLARVLLLTWLLGPSEFGTWGLGMMVFSILAPIAVLGSHQGIARYVSFYQARGRLREFLRRAATGICFVAGCTGLTALACSGWIARLLASTSGASEPIGHQLLVVIAVLGVVNGLLMALYHNLQACMRGMRTFRLLAAMELTYAFLFTVGALVGGAVWPRGYTVLIAHASSLAILLAVGGWAARSCLAYHGDRPPPDQDAAAGPPDEPDNVPVLARLLRFGVVAMLAPMVWNLGNQVSAWFIHRHHGSEALGVYIPYRQLCQPVWVLSGIVWGLVFSYVVRHWEFRLRPEAARMLNVAYKGVVLTLMTVSVLIRATRTWWGMLLPEAYRDGLGALPGLLLFFQCSANLGMFSIVAKLREKPMTIVAVLFAGAAVN
ncbi:hypothetical protein LCGC14_1920190, partial [marine sediment metagenome]